MMNVNIGMKLRALRKAKGLTTQQLANKVAVSQSYISRFENNRAVPDIIMLESILTALDTDLATFFANDDTDFSVELLQLIDTVKKLSPEARIKLNEFIQIILTEKQND